MNILNGLFGNKAVLNLVLGTIKTRMSADNISAIVITQKSIITEDDPSPGLDVRAIKEKLVILTGDDIEAFKQWRASEEMTPEEQLLWLQFLAENKGQPEQPIESAEEQALRMEKQEKEVSHGV
jgi:hypothetical protein